MSLTPSIRDAKEHPYQERRLLVARITDRLGTSIDAGILDTVVFLNLLGIPTMQSCEGHVEDGVGAPWVDVGAPMVPPPDEADAMFQQARQLKAQVGFTTEVLELFEQAHRAERARRMAWSTKHSGGGVDSDGQTAWRYYGRKAVFPIQFAI